MIPNLAAETPPAAKPGAGGGPRLTPEKTVQQGMAWLDQAQRGLRSVLAVGVADGIGHRGQGPEAQRLAGHAPHPHDAPGDLEIRR